MNKIVFFLFLFATVFAAQAVQLKHTPFLTHAGANGVTVNFSSDQPVSGAVDYRPAGTTNFTRQYEFFGGQIRNDLTKHTVVLSGLKPDTLYEYRPVLIREMHKENECIYGEIRQFRTFGRNKFRVFYTSDTQFSAQLRKKYLQTMSDRCGSGSADLFIHGGDVDDNLDSAYPVFIESFTEILCSQNKKSIPLLLLRGNHEYRGKESLTYFRYFGGREQKSYGAFRMGEVCFIYLDSGEDKERWKNHPHYARTFDRTLIAEQRQFLEELVKSDKFLTAGFKVVLTHGVPFANNGYWGKERYISGNIHAIAGNLLCGKDPAHKVHLWIAAHTHRYSRSVQPGSMTVKAFKNLWQLPTDPEDHPYAYVINGGPGSESPAERQCTALMLDFDGGKLFVKAMDLNGKVFDHFSVDASGKVTEIFSILENYTDMKPPYAGARVQ